MRIEPRSRVFLLALVIVGFTGHAAGLELSGSGESTIANQQVIDLEYTNSDLGNDLTVSYYQNGSLIGSSSDNTSNYRVEFNSTVSDSFEVFNITAEASNSSSYANESRDVMLEVDTDSPRVESGSFSYDRNDDGSINVSFTIDENGTGLKTVELVRRNDGTHRLVNTVEPEKKSGSFELQDRNEKNIYGEEFKYTVIAEDSAGNTINYDYDVSISPKDGEPPFITDVKPEDGATINNKNARKFSVSLNDSLSGIDSVNVTIDTEIVEVTNINSENRTVTIDISKLDNMETFTAEIDTSDNAGNTASYTRDFTTDRTPPEIEGDIYPDEDFIQEKTRLGIDVSGEDVGQVEKVMCYLGDKKLETDTRPNNNDVYSCGKVDPANYSDGEKTLYAEYYDAVGNYQKTEIGSWVFDTRKPVIQSIDLVPKYGWKAPTANVNVRDQASEIDEIEYWFDAYGERETESNIPDLKSTDVSFSPDIDGFSSGKYTLKMRVSDQTGKWSDTTEVEYNLRRERRPKPKLEYQPIELSSNGTETFEITLGNTAEVGLLSTNLKLSGAVEGSKSVEYIPRKSSKDLEFRITSLEDTGVYNSTLVLESQTQTKKFKVKTILRATEDERKQLESEVDDLKVRLDSLRANYSSIDKSRVREGRLEMVSSEVSRFNQSLDHIKSLSESGEYYRVAEELPEVRNQSKAAESSVENLRQYESQLDILIYVILGAAPVTLVALLYLIKVKGIDVIGELRKRLLPVVYKPYHVLKGLVPVSELNSLYRDIRYSSFGTSMAVKSYKIKRRIKRLLKRDGVDWKGYH